MLHIWNVPFGGARTDNWQPPILLWVILIIAPWTAAVNAEQALNQLTLSSAIRQSLAQNPSLRAFEFRRVALGGQKATAGLSPAYELGFEAENFSGSGELSGLDSAELTISLSSVIEMGDKRSARVKVANSRLQQLEAQQQAEALELLGEVTRRYIDVLTAQERVVLAREAVQLAQNTLSEVTKRAARGAIPEAEVKRAQASAEQARLTYASERQQLEYSKHALAVLWGERTPAFSTVKGNLYQFGKDIEFRELYAKVQQNPAIQFLATQERLKEAEVRLARTQTSMDIRWSVGLRQLRETEDTAITAGFNVPLFSSTRRSGSMAAAMAARDEVRINREAALLTLHTQLFRAFSYRQQAIVTSHSLQNSIIPSRQQALKETQQAYQRGRYSYLDYLVARQELIAARRSLIEAASAALHYGADIEQLTATSLSASNYHIEKVSPGLSP